MGPWKPCPHKPMGAAVRKPSQGSIRALESLIRLLRAIRDSKGSIRVLKGLGRPDEDLKGF